jgi:MoaA/NifB/PqqE/SkfB family radical SAM enzyme
MMDIRSIFSPFKLDWIQIEVSSCCNASCVYCPAALFRDQEVNRHMSLETFKKLVPAFSKTKMIHLQGWGEPLLNPDFFEMLRLATAPGLQVGTTTNGTCLDGDMVERLVRSGIDTVGFSLASVGDHNDGIRKGTKIENVLESLREVKRIKEALSVSNPSVHIAYMLLRSGLDELARLPDIFQGLGLDQIVISTLDFVLSPELAGEQLLPADESEYQDLKERLDFVVRSGQERGLHIHYRLATPVSSDKPDLVALQDGEMLSPFVLSNAVRPACTENVLRSVFITANGDASPCVYSNIPAREAEYVKHGVAKTYQRLTFGNVNHQSLEAIWRSRPYAAFRRAYQRRDFEGLCADCVKTRL